ncbi:MAG: metallophosphoesterase, partial [Methanosarcinales archaeon]|nr:metallophosphoesterase [Methanosarcinales archaeon]
IMCPGSPTVPRLADKSVIELTIEGDRVRGQVISLGAGACFGGMQK